jgi:hypothetical protein
MSSPSDPSDPSREPDPSVQPGPPDASPAEVRPPDPSAPSGPPPSWPGGQPAAPYPGQAPPPQVPPQQGPPPQVAPQQQVPPQQGPPPQVAPQQQVPPQQGYPPQGFPPPGSYAPPAAGPNPYIQNTPFTPPYGPQKSSIKSGGVFIGVGISVLVILIAFLIHDIPGGTGPLRLLVTGLLPIVGCLLTISRRTRSIGLGMVIIGGAFWVTLIGPCFALFMP